MMYKKRIRTLLFYLEILVAVSIVVLPFLWMLSTSFKGSGAIRTIPIKWIPDNPTLDNYIKVFNIKGFSLSKAAFNSFFIATASTFVQVMSASMAAYVFAKIPFKGRDKLFLLYLTVMMIPETVTMIPNYTILGWMHLVDSYTGIIILSLMGNGTMLNIFIMRQSMMGIHDAYLEAAEIDGASKIKIFFHIIMPMCKPTLATIILLSFMGNWNAYLKPLIILSSNDKLTLQLVLATMSGQLKGQENVIMAGAVLTIIPILVVYCITQKYVEDGLEIGGIKG